MLINNIKTEKEIVSDFIKNIKNLGYKFTLDKENVVVRWDTPYYIFYNEIGLKEERSLKNFETGISERIRPEDLRVYRDKEFNIDYVENNRNEKIKNFHLLPEVDFKNYTVIKEETGFYYITHLNNIPYYVYNMENNKGLVCDETGVFWCEVGNKGEIKITKAHTKIPQEYWGKIKIIPKTEKVWDLQYVDPCGRNRRFNILRNSSPFLHGDIRVDISPDWEVYIKLIPQGKGFKPTLIDEVGYNYKD